MACASARDGVVVPCKRACVALHMQCTPAAEGYKGHLNNDWVSEAYTSTPLIVLGYGRWT